MSIESDLGLHSLRISVPCSIKGCNSFTQVMRPPGPDEFVLCTSCEHAIVVGGIQKLANAGMIGAETPGNFAKVFAAFRRRYKGVAVPIRPASVGN